MKLPDEAPISCITDTGKIIPGTVQLDKPKLPKNPPIECDVFDGWGYVGKWGGPNNYPEPHRSFWDGPVYLWALTVALGLLFIMILIMVVTQ